MIRSHILNQKDLVTVEIGKRMIGAQVSADLGDKLRELRERRPELEFTAAWKLPGLFASAQRVERDDWSSGVKPAPVYRYVDSRRAKTEPRSLREALRPAVVS